MTIAVRTELNNFLATKPAEHELVERVRKYVRLSLESAAASLTTVDGAACAVADASLPLLVFEDAFDATPVASASALWGVLEECRDELAAIVNAHQRYRMPLLRTCTALMRRLSRSQHTVRSSISSCDPIVMLLAPSRAVFCTSTYAFGLILLRAPLNSLPLTSAAGASGSHFDWPRVPVSADRPLRCQPPWPLQRGEHDRFRGRGGRG